MILLRWRKAPIKCFEQEFRQETLSAPVDLGIRTVDIDRIVGSVGRCMDFREGFVPRRGFGSADDRLKRIKKAFEELKELPVIELYKVRDEYYVLDGHHRVAAGKAVGRKYFDAHVLEYLPTDENPRDALYRERALFEFRTKLDKVGLSEKESYNILMREIEEYRNRLQSGTGAISLEDAARRWYYEVYRPRIEEIEKSGILQFFSEMTPTDLYACLSKHQDRFRKMHTMLVGEPPKDMDFKRLTAQLYSLIEKDRNVTSKETLRELQDILPPCAYLKFCPRWPKEEKTSIHVPGAGSLLSRTFSRLKRTPIGM